MTILEFADYIREKVGNSVGVKFQPLPSDDPKIRRPDISKAKRVLGWEPRVHSKKEYGRPSSISGSAFSRWPVPHADNLRLPGGVKKAVQVVLIHSRLARSNIVQPSRS